MPLFRKKIICKKFYTYRTNTIDISGLTTGLSTEQAAGFDLKVGQFKLSPEFTKASNKLQELDLMQYSICQSIKNISDNSKRDELLIKLVDIKMQMLKIAQQTNETNENNNVKGATIENTQIAEKKIENKEINSQNLNKKNDDFSKKRLNNIETELNYSYDLLADWEQKLILSQNPKEQKLCEYEIVNLKKIIANFQTEYNQIKND